MNKQQDQDFDTGLPADEIGGFVDAFFEQLEPKPRKGRAWTFDRLNAACDTPGAEPVQAVLYPDDEAGFALYARQGRTLRAVTYHGRAVRFRTIEKAHPTTCPRSSPPPTPASCTGYAKARPWPKPSPAPGRRGRRASSDGCHCMAYTDAIRSGA